MIVSVKKAILHILDGNSGITVFSDQELDVSDGVIEAFICRHVERAYSDSALRPAEFNKSSGFKNNLSRYIEDELEFQKFSLFIAETVYDGISQSDKIDSSDLLVCDCIADDTPIFAVLKCENKIGYTHQVVQGEGVVKTEIINHYAILPGLSQKISECAFVNMNDFSVKYIGKKRNIEGESVDIMAELLLDCTFDISSRESFNKVQRIAKNVAKDNGTDDVEAVVKMKKFVAETIHENEFIEPEEMAQAVFDQSVSMREEFIEKVRDAQVPEKVEITEYVTKKINSNVKIVTDTGVELSFPAEYYRDSRYVDIINNPDGTLSIQINNVGEISNK